MSVFQTLARVRSDNAGKTPRSHGGEVQVNGPFQDAVQTGPQDKLWVCSYCRAST